MMPTYTNLNNNQKDRIHRLIMRTARMTLNSYCFKKSVDFILGSCNWMDINEMIKLSAVKFINNLLIKQKPEYLYSKLKISRRVCSKISFYRFPKSSSLKNTVLYRGIGKAQPDLSQELCLIIIQGS